MNQRYMRGAIIALVVLFSSPASLSKPKIQALGCTNAQIQSPAASKCIDEMNSDVGQGSATVHGLYCSSDGRILCCEYDTTKVGWPIVDHSCTVIGLHSHPTAIFPGSRPQINPGQNQSLPLPTSPIAH